MASVESFSTIGLDPRRKLTYWNDRACETFSPLVSDPADIRSFNGSIDALDSAICHACRSRGRLVDGSYENEYQLRRL